MSGKRSPPAQQTRSARGAPQATAAAKQRRDEMSRRRLQATEALRRSFHAALVGLLQNTRLPETGWVSYLAEAAAVTRTAARRWLDPGLDAFPDVVSLALVCDSLDCRTDTALGRPRHGESGAARANETAFIDALFNVVEQGAIAVQVDGDEMAPTLEPRDWVLVNTAVKNWASGMFVLHYQGKNIVRRIEVRIGEGYVLKCDNPRHQEVVVADEAIALEMGIVIVGRVTTKVCAMKV